MKKKSILAIILLVALIVVLHQTREARRFNRFEACMEKNGFDYSDALCEYCWEQVN